MRSIPTKCRNVAPGRGAVTELPVRKSTRVHRDPVGTRLALCQSGGSSCTDFAARRWSWPPFAIVTLAKTGIETPRDLEGRILGAPAPDGAYAQWKAFVKENGIDASKATIENVGSRCANRCWRRARSTGAGGTGSRQRDAFVELRDVSLTYGGDATGALVLQGTRPEGEAR